MWLKIAHRNSGSNYRPSSVVDRKNPSMLVELNVEWQYVEEKPKGKQTQSGILTSMHYMQ